MLNWMDARNFAERLNLRGSRRLATAFLEAFDAMNGTPVFGGSHASLGDDISHVVRDNNDRLLREAGR